jgi:Zn-dependent protease with chaperone function
VRVVRAALVISAIPLIGLIVYWTIIFDILGGPNVLAPFLLTYACELSQPADEGFRAACGSISGINSLGIASLLSLLIGLAIPGIFWLTSRLVGSNRLLLASVFPPLTFVAIILLAVLFFVHAGILAAGAYYAESYWVGRIHLIFVGLLGLTGAVGAAVMVLIAFKMYKPVSMHVIGTVASRDEFPKLHSFITSVAQNIHARHPDNIVLLLDDQFYATSATINVLGHDNPLSGETLCLSLPLIRTLSLAELRAVVGHELGHFSGKDTAYSLRFAPIYRGLAEAASVVSEDEDDPNPIGMPLRLILQSMWSAFSLNEAHASRAREIEADSLDDLLGAGGDWMMAVGGVVFVLLKDIAKGDGKVSEAEKILLEKVRTALELEE